MIVWKKLLIFSCLTVLVSIGSISFAKPQHALKHSLKAFQSPPVHAKAWGTKKPWKLLKKNNIKFKNKNKPSIMLKHAKNLGKKLWK